VCRPTFSDVYIPVNTPLSGWGVGVEAATQTFAPGGKYPRAATDSTVELSRVGERELNSQVTDGVGGVYWVGHYGD